MTGSAPPAKTPPSRRFVCLLLVFMPFALAAWLRLAHLRILEPFVDEGVNILTALDPRVRAIFDPIGQGRPLLAVQFSAAAFFPDAPLAAARTMTALAGLVTMAALAWVLRVAVGRGAALLGLWLMAVMPFAVWHERLVLQDPFISALLAMMLAFITTVSRPSTSRTTAALGFGLAGVLFGVAFLTKISALFAVPWLALVFVAIRRHLGRKILDRDLAWLAAGALLPLLMLGGDLPLLGSALNRYESLPTLSVANGWGAAVAASIAAGFVRGEQWIAWYAGYGGWPLALLLVAAITGLFLRPNRLAWFAGAGWLLTLIIDAALYNTAHARYAHPDHLPLILCIAASLGAEKVLEGWKAKLGRGAIGVAAIALVGWFLASWKIVHAPRHAPVPADEIVQYVNGPWSGDGIGEVRRVLHDQLAREPSRSCIVLTHRFLRPGCYAMMLDSLGEQRLAVLPWTVYDPGDLASARAALSHRSTQPPATVFLLCEGSLYPAAPWLGRPGSGTTLVLDVPHGEHDRWMLYRCEL